jgi:hypothetical protein
MDLLDRIETQLIANRLPLVAVTSPRCVPTRRWCSRCINGFVRYDSRT